MLLRVPDYYNKFHCIAGACKHNCCIGWEIDIDEDSYDYYQSIEGPFGNRLRQNMITQEEGENSFVLKHERCSMLNDKNLCDICMELGEESLCDICTEYPRFTTEYEDVTEKCLGLSCEEVCKIVLGKKDKVTFLDISMGEQEKEWDMEEGLSFLEAKEEREMSQLFLVIRAYALALLQNREYKINKRLKQYLWFCQNVQKQMNTTKQLPSTDDIKKIYLASLEKEKNGLPETKEKKEYVEKEESFATRRMAYSKLEVLNEEWPIFLEEMQKFEQGQRTEEAIQHWNKYFDTEEIETEFEQLAVYFTIRYFMRCVYTKDLLSQACFAIESILFIKDMYKTDFFKQKYELTKEDRYDLVRMYSSEVEHSQDNIEQIMEWFLYEESFKPAVLLDVLEKEWK